MGDDACPDCGGELRFEEKDSSSGRDMREYRCVKCGRSVVEDRGVALWQLLHDANEERQQREAEPAAQKPRGPWWRFWEK